MYINRIYVGLRSSYGPSNKYARIICIIHPIICIRRLIQYVLIWAFDTFWHNPIYLHGICRMDCIYVYANPYSWWSECKPEFSMNCGSGKGPKRGVCGFSTGSAIDKTDPHLFPAQHSTMASAYSHYSQQPHRIPTLADTERLRTYWCP
jgi:hypothetical protein